jgi:hypothetical protein
LIERARAMSAEEVWSILPARTTATSGKTASRFSSRQNNGRPGLHSAIYAAASGLSIPSRTAKPRKPVSGTASNNQVAIDMLQPGDVLVVDLMGKSER